jgi:hypothetical protein
MKFIKTKESNAHGNPIVYEFHVEVGEMKLLLGIVKRFLSNVPIGEQWLQDTQRARNIRKALAEIVEPKDEN